MVAQRFGLVFVGLLGLATVFPCQSAIAQSKRSGSPRIAFPNDPQRFVQFSVIRTGQFSNIDRQSIQSFTNVGELQTYWMHAMGQAPGNAPGGIDWVKQKVVAVNLGSRPSGGYNLIVRGVERSGMISYVHVVETKPSDGQDVSNQRTSPFVLIAVDRIAAKVELDLCQQSATNLNGIDVYGNGATVIRNGGVTVYMAPQYNVTFDVLGDGSDAGFYDQGVYTIDSQDQWDQYSNAMVGDSRPVPGGIDWNQSQIVAVHLGSRPSAGYTVRVERIESKKGKTIIHAVETAPTANSASVSTHPYVFVKVPRTTSKFTLDLTKK